MRFELGVFDIQAEAELRREGEEVGFVEVLKGATRPSSQFP